MPRSKSLDFSRTEPSHFSGSTQVHFRLPRLNANWRKPADENTGNTRSALVIRHPSNYSPGSLNVGGNHAEEGPGNKTSIRGDVATHHALRVSRLFLPDQFKAAIYRTLNKSNLQLVSRDTGSCLDSWVIPVVTQCKWARNITFTVIRTLHWVNVRMSVFARLPKEFGNDQSLKPWTDYPERLLKNSKQYTHMYRNLILLTFFVLSYSGQGQAMYLKACTLHVRVPECW